MWGDVLGGRWARLVITKRRRRDHSADTRTQNTHTTHSIDHHPPNPAQPPGENKTKHKQTQSGNRHTHAHTRTTKKKKPHKCISRTFVAHADRFLCASWPPPRVLLARAAVIHNSTAGVGGACVCPVRLARARDCCVCALDYVRTTVCARVFCVWESVRTLTCVRACVRTCVRACCPKRC